MTFDKKKIKTFFIEFDAMVDIKPDTIFTPRRFVHIVVYREIAFYILRENNVPCRLIGEVFESLGGINYDHSTILHAQTVVTDMLVTGQYSDIPTFVRKGMDLYTQIVNGERKADEEDQEI